VRTRHPFPDVEFEETFLELHRASTENLIPPIFHPDAVERGAEIALGFRQHSGENRQQRRKAGATWVPPKTNGAEATATASMPAPAPVTASAPAERMPTRRSLLKQRRKHQRGKLDVELRRLQNERLK
jgi:hypothetical protein